MESLYTAFSVLFSVLVASAFLMVAYPQMDGVARLMIGIAGLILCSWWIMWSFTTDSSWWQRALVGAIIGSAVFALVPAFFYWSKDRLVVEKPSSENIAGKSNETQSTIAEPPKQEVAKPNGSVGIRADGVNGLYMEGNTFIGIDTPMDIKNSSNVVAKNNKATLNRP